MSRSHVFRVLLLTAIVALAAVPATALGAKPDRFHAHFDDFVSGVDVCGIIVDIHSEGVFTDQVTFDKAGNFLRFKSTASAKTTFTAANGKSVIVQNAGQFTDVAPIIDEAAGTITFITTFKGLPEKIKTPNGGVLLRDAGLISFVDTFDLATGALISSETIVKGPHPEADSDFQAFCQVFTAALA
jgi:hypothetical protein